MAQIITSDIREVLRKEFATLTGNVKLLVFTKKGLNDKFNDLSLSLCKELAGLSEKIQFKHIGVRSNETKKYGITTSTSPVILLNPGKSAIRFVGAPIGEEVRSLVAGIKMVSHGRGDTVRGVNKGGEGAEGTPRGVGLCKPYLPVLSSTGGIRSLGSSGSAREHKRLGVPGEVRFFGRGVSYCATCDGYFFKDGKKVILAGGGNTAVTEALYLDSIGVDVTVVHRGDKLRAEERLQQNLKDRRIPVLWNTVVLEILGDTVVNAVKLKNLKNGKISPMHVDGVFVAVGYEPANELAKKLGLELTGDGYIKVDERQRTSMSGVYAAGDVTGGVKQIVTAVGQGSIAAITAFEDLMNPYWKDKGR